MSIPIRITAKSGIPIRDQKNAVNKAVVSDRPDAIPVHIADYGTPFVVEGLVPPEVPWTLNDIPEAMRIGEWNAARAQTSGGRITAIPNRWPASGPAIMQATASRQPLLGSVNGFPTINYPSIGAFGLYAASPILPAWWAFITQYGDGTQATTGNSFAFMSSGQSATAMYVNNNSSTLQSNPPQAVFSNLMYNGATGNPSVFLPRRFSLVEMDFGTDIPRPWGPGAAVTTNSYFGHFAMAMALSSVPSADLRQRIEGRLAWDFGLQADLPANHPYRNAPPTKAAS